MTERKLDHKLQIPLDLTNISNDVEEERKYQKLLMNKIFVGKDKDINVCMGGILLSALNGKIIIKNTLDIRSE